MWLYLAVVIGAWFALRFGGDRWWWATVLLFSPRWLWAIPLAVLIPAMLIWRRRRWWLAAATALWVAGPLMGLCVSWPHTTHHSPLTTHPGAAATTHHPPLTTHPLRVLTCNTGVGGYDLQSLAKLIVDNEIDVVSLQEQAFERELLDLLPERWKAWSNGEIVLVTKFPVLDQKVLPRQGPAGHGDASGRQTVAIDFRLDTPGGPIDFVAVHLFTPRKGLEAVKETLFSGIDRMRSNVERRSEESERAARWVAELPGPVVIAGDLNLPPESAVFRRDWSGYTDAFSAAGTGYGFTFGYTYSGRWFGIRIDHILAGEGWTVEKAWVGPHVDSDHRPVIADLVAER